HSPSTPSPPRGRCPPESFAALRLRPHDPACHLESGLLSYKALSSSAPPCNRQHLLTSSRAWVWPGREAGASGSGTIVAGYPPGCSSKYTTPSRWKTEKTQTWRTC